MLSSGAQLRSPGNSAQHQKLLQMECAHLASALESLGCATSAQGSAGRDTVAGICHDDIPLVLRSLFHSLFSGPTCVWSRRTSQRATADCSELLLWCVASSPGSRASGCHLPPFGRLFGASRLRQSSSVGRSSAIGSVAGRTPATSQGELTTQLPRPVSRQPVHRLPASRGDQGCLTTRLLRFRRRRSPVHGKVLAQLHQAHPPSKLYWCRWTVRAPTDCGPLAEMGNHPHVAPLNSTPSSLPPPPSRQARPQITTRSPPGVPPRCRELANRNCGSRSPALCTVQR